MLDHDKKLTLVRDLIDAGITDPSIIVETIKRIEEGLFNRS
ncbi:hypothetical protein [Acinetobacter pollinis]|nr:hypothetical protein [Acinetobacter pollinis]